LELIIVFVPVILQVPYDGIVDFASFGWLALPEFICAENFVYVDLLLISKKKNESHNTKHNLPRQAGE
jgi:hypothetical protein